MLRAVAVEVFLEGVAVRDMAGNLRKRRGKGQRVEAMFGLEEETRKQTERAVRMRSGREGRVVSGCGGGNISRAAVGGGALRRVGVEVHGGNGVGFLLVNFIY